MGDISSKTRIPELCHGVLPQCKLVGEAKRFFSRFLLALLLLDATLVGSGSLNRATLSKMYLNVMEKSGNLSSRCSLF